MSENNHEVPQLSDTELIELRTLLENEKRMVWLRSSIRVWVGYTAAFIIGAFALYKAVSEYFLLKIGVR
jgi:hypothetical protein